MDLLAHVVYGATACSKSGLAGGRSAQPVSWYRDRSVWAACVFGILPDLVSMGPPFLLFLFSGMEGNFFRDLHEAWLVPYRYAHSMTTALAAVLLVRLVRRELVVPSLALPLHAITDALTHGSGKFFVPTFYPFASWGIEGIAWWRHPEVVWLYWAIPPATWLTLRLARRPFRRTP